MTFRNAETFHAVGINAIIGVGSGFILFGLANIYSFLSVTPVSVAVGVIGIVVGFAFFGWGLSKNKQLFGKIVLPGQKVLSFQPVQNDRFSIVIDGVGSFGNPENQANVDVIVRNMVRELINNATNIRTASFHSRNGSMNLLTD